MSEQKIENIIGEVLTGEAQKNALEFVAYLRANEMLFERGNGYWENQLYWLIKYKNEYVCFILINGTGTEEKFKPWTIWSDDSDSNWFENFPLNEHMKEIAWKYIDFCGNCGSCSGGTRKTIFEKEFNNVCRTTMRFIDPDTETVELMIKMVDIRKSDILKKN